jgi:hypothetical protein
MYGITDGVSDMQVAPLVRRSLQEPRSTNAR